MALQNYRDLDDLKIILIELDQKKYKYVDDFIRLLDKITHAENVKYKIEIGSDVFYELYNILSCGLSDNGIINMASICNVPIKINTKYPESIQLWMEVEF